MKLYQFRQKLKREIEELENMIVENSPLPQSIQPTIVCIAALSRAILDKLKPKLECIIENVQVLELRHKNDQKAEVCDNITLRSLLNAVIHYADFRPSYLSAERGSSRRYITVVSDWEIKQNKWIWREVAVEDFIKAVYRIAADNQLILHCLLSHAEDLLGRVIDSESDDEFLEVKTRDILIDFCDIASEIKDDNWPDGKITILREEIRHAESIVTQTEKIEYKVFIDKMGKVWFFDHFRKFEPDKELGKVLELEDRMKDPIEFFMIRVEDMRDALYAMEYQWGKMNL